MAQASEQIENLNKVIAALEAQRASLGDAAVDVALVPLIKHLTELEAQAAPTEQQRKQVTVLFADVSGFTAMSEMLDAEDVTEMMNALWVRLDAAITAHGGMIDKHIGDGVMALWGAKAAREDDPERAIRAALAMQAEIRSFVVAHCDIPLQMRIGLNTGPVLLGQVGSTREFTAMGDTVNLASRMERAAPVGGILITHDTYRHVRGMFDVQAQAPLSVKGKVESVQTYSVQGTQPRAFWVRARGVEGVETRMVGRDAELKRLQDAYLTVLERGELQAVTVLAEAGAGKSRLLHEFDIWTSGRPEQRWVFKGRASQEMQALPYTLLRDVFSFRFQIQDRDPLKVVCEKMEVGVGAALELPVLPACATATQNSLVARDGTWPAGDTQVRAHFIGHLLGFDFSDSPHLKGILEDARQIRDRALTYIGDYFRAMTVRLPVLILLEDLHWADDSSLDVLDNLLRVLAGNRLLVIGAARPSLLERRMQWASGPAFHTRLDLSPLSRQDSLVLVSEILQKVDELPDTLCEMVVSKAEGNPFYVEELIKMLIEEGVVIKGEDRWQVNPVRLAEVRVPSTLNAVLQARFDSLPAREKVVLQRASVLGRAFWAEAVVFLDNAREAVLTDTLAALAVLRGREMVFQRETSTFAATAEYIFKHTLLRDATYESVLKRERRVYHARAAEWLMLNCGARENEFVGLIAEHLERAAQTEQAVKYLARAGTNALGTYAYREAVDYFARALALLPAASCERIPLLMQSGQALWYLGEYTQAQTQLQAGLALAQQHGDDGYCADALIHLGSIARKQGDWVGARAYLNESLRLARRTGDQRKIAHALHSLAWVDTRQGAYPAARLQFAESRTLFQVVGDLQGLADALNGLGAVTLNLGEYGEARAFYQESLMLFQRVQDRPGESAALVNLGETARRQGDYAAAWQYYEKALAVDREMGDGLLAAITLGNLGHTALACGDYSAAEGYYQEGLQTALSIGAIPDILDILAGMAGVLARIDKQGQALEVLGLVLHHPALDDESRQIAAQALAALQANLPSEVVEAGLERGKSLNLEKVVLAVLADPPLAVQAFEPAHADRAQATGNGTAVGLEG